MPEAIYLAFDFGLKKIGVAIGNSLTGDSRPLGIVQEKTKVDRFAKIEALLNEWQPNKLIVGLPLTMDGQEQYASLHARRFANQLHGRFGLEVILVDERMSSLEAQQLVGNKADDAVAAAIILQRYLDAQGEVK